MATNNALTDYAENFLVTHLLRAGNTQISDVYAALFTASPGESGSQTNEVSGGGYTRVNITDNGGFSAPSNGSTSNAQNIEFPTATANWGTVTHVGICDAQTSGHVLCYVEADTSRAVLSGDSVRIRTGELDFNLA